MPRFELEMTFARPVAEVFGFFCLPANWIKIAPPELHLRLLHGPERLHLGASLTLKGRRWGMPQRMVNEITAFEPPQFLREEQRQGPFVQWIHTQRFEQAPRGTRLVDQVEYEPPGGMLGMIVSADFLAEDLARIFAWRCQKLREWLGE